MESFDGTDRKRLTRRRLLMAGLVAGAGLAVYGGELERHWIEVNEIDLALNGLADEFTGMRVVQLSDIHMDEYTEPFFLKQAIARVNSLRPDAVMLTGDFISQRPLGRRFGIGAAWQCANLLKGLVCKNSYAVMGNHDVSVAGLETTEALTANGVNVLTNRCIPFERGKAKIWFAGIDDPLLGEPNPARAVPESIQHIAGEPVILLCHEPDYVDTLLSMPLGRSIALVLSGHTHGGQVRLPFVGPLTLPELGKKYVQGLFRFGNMQLYVNRGLGTVGLPVRFDCPPEITLFTLRRA